MGRDVLLKMEGISKTFPGVKALDNVKLEVKAGTVHALMGENGAGKSTLMKCLFGIYGKDEGHIYLEGKEVAFKSSKEALDNGVIAGAGLDVFESEGGNLDKRLFSMKSVALTPHVAWNTYEGMEALHIEVTENVMRFLDGKEPESIVNKLKEV